MATANVSKSVSPGAALLRASRMFSMPAPISAPSDVSLATKHKSETATAPFPTHLSVTTPHSSRMIGDWGFKRPLPLKTTTKSTLPLVRVRKVDSIEHVTDFQSASDHTITLAKWHEMNVNITVPQSKTDQTPPKSVFEDAGDVTALSETDKIKKEGVRWRFNGPWLAGMTDGQFNEYLTKTVRGKRSEFRSYLREQCASEITARQREEAAATAEESPPQVLPSDITEEVFTEYLRMLRNDRVILFRHVSRFLDLAPLSAQKTFLAKLGHLNPGKEYEFADDNPYASNGPPITHPSAGLSYLRTKSYLDNHPIYGPQQHHPPVKARIVAPRKGSQYAKMGMAGIIAGIPQGETAFNNRGLSAGGRNAIPGLNDFLPDVAGGSKVYLQPQTASIDATGKILIKTETPNASAEVVQKEMVGEAEVFEKAVKESKEPAIKFERPREVTRWKSSRSQPRMGNSQSYGFGGSGSGSGSFGRDV
ncbi:mitochondrial ribosomal protein MRP51 [Xylariales sp. AK1849]|nr:mitochondrial ribosomal protein MRP51 [Xylariales sp. AK1849]